MIWFNCYLTSTMRYAAAATSKTANAKQLAGGGNWSETCCQVASGGGGGHMCRVWTIYSNWYTRSGSDSHVITLSWQIVYVPGAGFGYMYTYVSLDINYLLPINQNWLRQNKCLILWLLGFLAFHWLLQSSGYLYYLFALVVQTISQTSSCTYVLPR